ncbi:arsenic resistance protein [Nonomuraea sp. WAC 01424]|uniref:bile acid:sodium symporter n=1 Tax=Nonomuraea sp. WAC 01424 TaxID=2203200 RepID=UPI000F771B13|nr:bile acid:sodium symporter [Nonomuraea sp. WAC 01424]RSM95242.1 arsenic resistance protein [Nonomuraea sp. WAC 01424]
MSRAVEWWDEHQIPLYLAAIATGALAGLAAPSIAPALEGAINPVLALLLFATFLAVPMAEVGRAFRDVRFLVTALVANFVVVPVIVYGLSRCVADDRGLLLGLLLVLLTPCIDYVIVFTGLAGGARARLLAAAPLLMLAQMLLLPVYLLAFAGSDVLAVVEVAPFAEAFLVLIVAPLAAAALVQALARRRRAGRVVEEVMAGAMVPLMMATLAVVIGSQIAAVGAQVVTLARLVPLYALFVVLAVAVGLVAGRTVRLDVPATRAVMFSAATRNSLVVLPLALALPPALGIAPLAVVTQTLVELVAMVVLVRLVPRLVPEPLPADASTSAGHRSGRVGP